MGNKERVDAVHTHTHLIGSGGEVSSGRWLCGSTTVLQEQRNMPSHPHPPPSQELTLNGLLRVCEARSLKLNWLRNCFSPFFFSLASPSSPFSSSSPSSSSSPLDSEKNE